MGWSVDRLPRHAALSDRASLARASYLDSGALNTTSQLPADSSWPAGGQFDRGRSRRSPPRRAPQDRSPLKTMPSGNETLRDRARGLRQGARHWCSQSRNRSDEPGTAHNPEVEVRILPATSQNGAMDHREGRSLVSVVRVAAGATLGMPRRVAAAGVRPWRL